MSKEVDQVNKDLYRTSSMLRGYAKLFRGNGDMERGVITFDPEEADGISEALIGFAERIDRVRDELFG